MQIIEKKSVKTIRPHRDSGSINEFTIRYRYLTQNLQKNNAYQLYAEPLFSGKVIAWRTPLQGEIINYSKLSGEQQKEVNFILSQQINELLVQAGNNQELKKMINTYKKIPTSNDIYLIKTPTGDKVILTQWGCMLDDSNGTHYTIKADEQFPLPVVFKAIYQDEGGIASEEEIIIEFNKNSNKEITDENGLIDLGKVIKGTQLKAYQIVEGKQRFVHDFECDGSEYYIIELPPLQTMNFIVKDTNGEIQTNYNFTFEYNNKNEELTTDENGIIQLEKIKVFTTVNAYHQEDDKNLYPHDFICEQNKEQYLITIPAPIIEEPPPPPPPEPESVIEPNKIKVKLIDHKKRPIKNQEIEFKHKEKEYKLKTDEEGYCLLEIEEIETDEIIKAVVKVQKKKKKKKDKE